MQLAVLAVLAFAVVVPEASAHLYGTRMVGGSGRRMGMRISATGAASVEEEDEQKQDQITLAAARAEAHTREVAEERAEAHMVADDATQRQIRALYTPTAEMEEQIQALASKCHGMLTVSTVKDPAGQAKGPHDYMQVVRLQKPGVAVQKKIFVVGNEHAREVIAGETLLHFLKTVCANGGASAGVSLHEESSRRLLLARQGSEADMEASVTRVLSALTNGVSMIIVPVVNKAGRDQVILHGKICLRKTFVDKHLHGQALLNDNSDEGTDINRNGDVDWSYGETYLEGETHRGKAPFSTFEARILRQIASDEKPIAFLDIHSGATSIMYPFGYRMQGSPDYVDQEHAADAVKNVHCPNCQTGPNSVVIGYQNPGEIIDHMYVRQGIKYSMCWEVFEGANQQGVPAGVETGGCAGIFNPLSSKLLTETLQKWTGALSTFTRYVDQKTHSSEKAASAEAARYVEISDLQGQRISSPTVQDVGLLDTTQA